MPASRPPRPAPALRRKAEPSYMGTYTGARRYVMHTFATTQSAMMKKRVARFMTGAPCPECGGRRLKREALSVTFAGLDIGTLSQLPLSRIAEVLAPAAEGRFDDLGGAAAGSTRSKAAGVKDKARRVAAGGLAHAGGTDVRRTPDSSPEKRIAAQRIAHDLVERIGTLQALGLGYLAMDRSTPTLSPGELQRLRLATQIRSNLFGVVYVLDEPSAGLHPADGQALHRALDQLKAAGNTLFVVEHDLDTLRRADWLVDVGPGAGQHGGQVLYSGPPEGLRKVKESLTGRYLFDGRAAERRVPREPAGWLELRGVHRNNLHGIDARFPLGAFTAVTGVSGSGKSSLVSQALVELIGEPPGAGAGRRGKPKATCPNPALCRARRAASWRARKRSGGWSMWTRSRSDAHPDPTWPPTPVCFDHVRKLYAETKAARSRRYGAGRFSFNVAQGRCETCEGEGFVHVELAVHAQRVRALPHLPWQPLQRQDAGNRMERPQYRPGPGDDRRRGACLLQGRARGATPLGAAA